MLELYILLVFMIVGAIIALEVKDLLSSVIAVGVVGMVLSLAFLVLKAPDLAITQLVVEIVTVVILIRATEEREAPELAPWSGVINRFVAVGFIVLLAGVGLWCCRDLPRFGEAPMRVSASYLEKGLTETGAANLVSSVILDYRGYDTLGEATVLFTAVMGVLAVTRPLGRKPTTEAGEVTR